jgi:hypothetical protein
VSVAAFGAAEVEMGKVVAAAVATLGVGFLAGWLVRGAGRVEPSSATSAERAASSGAGTQAAEVDPAAAARGNAGAARPSAAQTRAGRSSGATSVAAADRPADDSAYAATAQLAAQQAVRIAKLEEDLRAAEAKLAQAARPWGEPPGPEDGSTAADRRQQAAREGKLMVEFPQWGDGISLTDEQAAKLGLSTEERAALDKMYSDFYAQALAEMKRLYRELTGDPTAGETSTLNGLLQNVIELSPPELCRARMAEALRLLAAGQPLPPPAADAPPCEVAIWFLFSNVDRMEQEATRMGIAAWQALWSGRSTFQFSGNDGGQP